MKKQDVISIFVYLAMIAVAIFVGLLVIKPVLEQAKAGSAGWGIAIGGIMVGFIGNAILFEVAHILGALVGGYKITSVNILGCNFYSKKGKLKFRFKGYDGLTGETKIAPKNANSNPKPYLLFGILFYIIEFAALMVTFYTVASTSMWGAFTVIILSVGGMLAIYNIIPAQLDSMNDGYRLTLLSKPINRVAFNELLSTEEKIDNGEKETEVKVFEEITDFTASTNFITIYKYLGEKNYSEALVLIDKLLENKDKLSEKFYYRAKAQKIYIMLVSSSLEEAKQYYDENTSAEERRFYSQDATMESLRAYILIAGLLDQSRGEVLFCINRKPKVFKKVLDGRKVVEQALYDEALAKIKEAHSDWVLEVN